MRYLSMGEEDERLGRHATMRDTSDRAVWVVLLLAVLLLLAVPACTRNSPTTPGGDPEDPEEPLYTTTTITEYYLVLEADGLYCLGYQRDGAETLYDAPRLWFPLEVTVGDVILSALFYPFHQRYLEVIELDRTEETPAGTFEGVIRAVGGDYDWADFTLCPDVGFLDYIIGGGRAYRYYYLQSLSVAPGGDEGLDFFGLAPGNAWTFTSSGSDSNGEIRYEGVVLRTVEGPVSVGGRQALVLRCEETTSAYDVSGLSTAGRKSPRLASRGISPAS
jgi:hypothetical protein